MSNDFSQFVPITQNPDALNDDASIVQMAFDICMQLNKRHKKQQLHFDVKPQTIFADEKGRYHLGDPTGQMIPHFTAPEILAGSPYCSYNCDTYSLGMVMYWLLNNRRHPFCLQPPYSLTPQMSQASQDRRLSGDPLPPPVNGSEELKALVLRACAFDPNNRFQTAREMQEALKDLGYKIKKPIRWGYVIPGIIAGILVASIAIGAWLIDYFVNKWIDDQIDSALGMQDYDSPAFPEFGFDSEEDWAVAETMAPQAEEEWVQADDTLHLSIGARYDDLPWLEEVARRYTEETGIPVSFEFREIYPGDAGMYAEAGQMPDIFLYDNTSSLRLHELGVLASINGWETHTSGNTYPCYKQDYISRGSDGNHYGIPVGGTTWFVYYNADVITDTSSIMDILDQGRLAFDMTNGWYTGAFFASGGLAFYGESGLTPKHYDMSGPSGYYPIQYLAEIARHPNYVFTEYGTDAVRNGEADAFFSGTWDAYAAVKAFEAVDGTMGICVVPDIEDGTSLGIAPFANYEFLGMNADCCNYDQTLDFMAYLGSVESLAIRYEYTGSVPCYSDCVDIHSPQTYADWVAAETLFHNACPQSAYLNYGNYWEFTTELGCALLDGSIETESDIENWANMMEDMMYKP